MLLAILDQLLYSRDLQIMLLCKLLQVIASCHHTIVAHDLTAKTNWFQSCNLHQIYRCLGVSLTLDHATWSCLEWEHMSRSAEIFRLRIVLHKLACCNPSLIG